MKKVYLYLTALCLMMLLMACDRPGISQGNVETTVNTTTTELTDVMDITNSEPESEPPTETTNDTESETSSETAPGTESEIQTEATSDVETETQLEATSETETEAETETETETEAETQLWNPIIVDEFVALGDVGFELVNHNPSVIDRYAAAICALAVDLDGLATVYELTAPASCCFGITGDQNVLLGASDPVAAMEYTHRAMQAENDRLIAEGLLQNPLVVMDICDLMGEKYAAGEYIYFRTDHHWTGLGAYYASRHFLDLVGKNYLPLSDYSEVALTGFLGSLHRHTQSEEMAANPDTVYAYASPTVQYMTVCNKNGQVQQIEMIRDSVSSTNKYVAFCGGDYPYSEIHNETITDGSAVLVIKDSYGNSFMPMLADSYEYVYGIDYRSWEGDLSAFVEEHNIDSVVIINYQVCISLSSYVRSWEKLVAQQAE
ncbi:MAG: hypothetical protein IKM33_06950 [Clostridia bacterium]|nr:hypothetical protein [Clostridia bacterium]